MGYQLFDILGVGILIIHGLLFFNSFFGSKQIKFLKNYLNKPLLHTPKVSVVFAAKDEEEDIEMAVHRLVEQDYPDFEIIAINDRSTDGTLKILETLSVQHKQLKVINIETLPKGWLGKNHAMYVGSQQAQGEWVLFTDADVMMNSGAISASIAYAQEKNLDFLTLVPMATSRAPIVNALVGYMQYLVGTIIQPWLLKVQSIPIGFGAGAFMLVKRQIYTRINGHALVRLRPDEDYRLGQYIKNTGASCDVVYGLETVIVEWYKSFRDMKLGLEKNVFAACQYSFFLTLGLALIGNLFYLFPWVLVFVENGSIQSIAIATCAVMSLTGLSLIRYYGYSYWIILFFPFSFIALQWICFRSVALTIFRQGIYWRSTFYPLKELKLFKLTKND